MWSAPPYPQMTSAPPVPVSVSGPDVPTIVHPRAFATTATGSVSDSFPGVGSGVLEVTFALLSNVPASVVRTTTDMKTLPPFPRLEFVQDTEPVDPTVGVVHDHPAGKMDDRNVIDAGRVSV